MNVIKLKDHYLKSMKRDLREQTRAGSVQLTEAIARGCGYRTNASLRAALLDGSADGKYVVFDEGAFRKRLLDFKQIADNTLDLPPLGHSSRYVEALFADPVLEILDLRPLLVRYRLAGIATVIGVDLISIGGGNFRFKRSHAIYTPSQLGPYNPGRDFDDDPAYAMHRAIDSVADYYRQAIREGHKPSASWLVERMH